MKKFKRIISTLIATVMTVSMAVPVCAYDAENISADPVISETDLSLDNNYAVTYKVYISQKVGDVVTLNDGDAYVITSREICKSESGTNTYYISTQYKPLIAPFSSTTGWYPNSFTFTYNTGTTIEAILKVRFDYDGTNAPTVNEYKTEYSDNTYFKDESVKESSNFITKSTTVKLTFKYLTGLGWKEKSVSVKCLKDGTQG